MKSGFFSALTQKVIADRDLDLQIRQDYLNIYFKGNSLLKLTEKGRGNYEVYIHRKITGPLKIRDIVDKQSAQEFLSQIPQLKENIVQNGKASLEIEYEQLISRANNLERRTNSEYFVIDRQYSVNERRFDLVGIFWDRNGRKKHQEVPLWFMEIKVALNQDIKDVHNQLSRYHSSISQRPKELAVEFEIIFKQKVELGLYDQEKNRIEALKTLKFSEDVEQFQFILFLVDYNPNSIQFNLDKLLNLPFAKQIRVFCGGFAMWQQNTIPIDDYGRKPNCLHLLKS